jgi:hypothetical protein
MRSAFPRPARGGRRRTSRLTGSTGNPYWHAEQLAALPAPFRVVGGVELQETTHAVGELLAASAPRSVRA